jgi:hypothetical protein
VRGLSAWQAPPRSCGSPFARCSCRVAAGPPPGWRRPARTWFSRIAYNNVFDPLFLVAAAGLFWQGWQRGDRRYFVAAGLCVGAGQFFYTTARLIPLLLLLWIPFLARARPADHTRWTGLAAAGLAGLAVVLPLFLLYAAHPDLLLFTSSRVSMLIPGWIEPVAEALGTTRGLISNRWASPCSSARRNAGRVRQLRRTLLGASPALRMGMVVSGEGLPCTSSLAYFGAVCWWEPEHCVELAADAAVTPFPA